MKIRLLHLLLTLACIALSGVVQAQDSERGTQGLRAGDTQWFKLKNKDYVATDIYGNKHNFAELLQSGKKIVIDFSAVWCEPCMQLHKRGALSDFYNRYGQGAPDGGEAAIFWVEIQGASMDEIRGNNALAYDWTDGGAFEVPIIADALMASEFLGFKVVGVPTLIVIGGDGYYAQMPTPASAQHIKDAIDQAYSLNDPPLVTLSDLRVVNHYDTQLSAEIHSAYDMESYVWTFEGGTPASSTEVNPTVRWDVEGNYKVSLQVTDVEGRTSSGSCDVVVLPKSDMDHFPAREQFADESLDLNWRRIDNDGDGNGWFTALEFFNQFGDMRDYVTRQAKSAPSFMCSWSYIITAFKSAGGYEGAPIKADNYLITPQIKFPADAQKPQVGFFVKSYENNAFDSFEVRLSTTGAKVEDFTTVVRELTPVSSTSWSQVVVDLDAYKGQDIYLAIVHKDEDKSGLFVDDFMVKIDGSLDAIRPLERVIVTLSQSDEALTIEGENIQEVSLVDMSGQAVWHGTFDRVPQVVIPTITLAQGSYIAWVTTARGSDLCKVVIGG